MNILPWHIEKIIEVTHTLQVTAPSGLSTSEIIVATFVLNHQDLLPAMYTDMVET